jgi:hypothetical protein
LPPAGSSAPWFSPSLRGNKALRGGQAQRVGHDRLDQIGIAHAHVPRLFGHEAERGHPRLGVHFQQEQARQAGLFIVPAEIGPAGALAAEQHVRAQRHVLAGLGDLRRNLGRADVVRHPFGVFGVEIVEARLGSAR